MILPAVSALPSTDSVTSNSCSLRLLALTLIWMLIWGGWLCCWSELGAFGFSNERSLVYCARTLSWGAWAASGGVPLPLVIRVSPYPIGLNFRGGWLTWGRLVPQGMNGPGGEFRPRPQL